MTGDLNGTKKGELIPTKRLEKLIILRISENKRTADVVLFNMTPSFGASVRNCDSTNRYDPPDHLTLLQNYENKDDRPQL